jgi:two-component system sensor histidine kinase UhpB
MDARSRRSVYIVGMTERPEGVRVRQVPEKLAARYRRTSLYVRVVAINAAVVAGATLVLAATPATVGYPIRLREAVVLVAGVLLVAVANALVLRISFGALGRVVRRMETVDLLRPQERLPVAGGPETRAVVAGLNQMLARLENERRESSRRTLAALEDERRRIAQELHDEIGQRLTGMLLQLGTLAPDAPAPLRERVAAIQEDARTTLDEVGVLAWQLRPGMLDDLGLERSLEALAESYAETGLGVRSSVPARLPALSRDAELAVYRIVQEALTNAARHAAARTVDLRVEVDGGRLLVTVSDDGVGLRAEQGDGAGIRGMRERALAIGATLTIEPAPRAGVRVRLALPPAAELD